MNQVRGNCGAARRNFDAVIGGPAMHIGLCTEPECIAEIVYLPRSRAVIAPRNRLAERAARQIERYLADPDAGFDFPLAEAGTDFQRRVWQAMRGIARGRTQTYGEMARVLGSAPRAVGQACGANPFPIVIPCHRVVAAGGLGGFSHASKGFLIEVKRWLLTHEHAPLG
ncbi:MAG: methylated-DNA--[protein]-cysteine S-methyltransferase [Betaproteobacteria bacterium]|nr:methylated-DNA--[protein]-cysteine S-methyltransferase [Betaproteobacteria bacterium]